MQMIQPFDELSEDDVRAILSEAGRERCCGDGEDLLAVAIRLAYQKGRESMLPLVEVSVESLRVLGLVAKPKAESVAFSVRPGCVVAPTCIIQVSDESHHDLLLDGCTSEIRPQESRWRRLVRKVVEWVLCYG